MKRFVLGAFALAALAVAACTPKEAEIVVPASRQITLTATGEAPATRTALQADGSSIFWTKDDALSVFYGEESAQFIKVGDDAEAVAKFTGELTMVTGATDPATAPSSKFWAVYPYARENKLSGEKISVPFAVQQTAVAGTFEDKTFPSVACSETFVLKFYNVCGTLAISVGEDNVTSVALKGNNGEKFYDRFWVEMDAEGHPKFVEGDGQAYDGIELVAVKGETLSKGSVYHFAVPPMVFEKGVTFELSYSDKDSRTHVVNNLLEVVRSNFHEVAGLTGDDPAGPSVEPGSDADHPMTVAQALVVTEGLEDGASADGAVFVTGKVKSITELSTYYGNATFILEGEDGSEITVYRCYSLDNQKFISTDELRVGDEIVVNGQLKRYIDSQGKRTDEIVRNADNGWGYIAKILVRANYVEATISNTSVEAAGAELTLTVKSNIEWSLTVDNGASVNPTSGKGDGTVSVTIPANKDNAAKTYTIKITAPDAYVAPADVIINQQEAGSTAGTGSLDNPFSVPEVIAYIDGSSYSADAEVYVKGKISSVKYYYSASFDTATYNISEDGSTTSTQFTCYGVYYLGNKKWVEGNTQIAVGDEVLIFGKVVLYTGSTPSVYETSNKKAYLYSLNGVTEAVVTPVTKYTITLRQPGVGGTISASAAEAAEGETITLTATPDSNYQLDTWTVTGADGSPVTVTGNQFTMPAQNVTVTASFKERTINPNGEEQIDVLNNAWTGISGTTYADKTGLKGSASVAEYSVNAAGGNSAIQLRTNKNNSGIVSTKSGGYIRKVVITWNSNTVDARTLSIYGKNTAYSAPSDLYDSSKQGTLLGELKKGETTLTISDNYDFIGIRSKDSALYLDEIKITWENMW